MTELKFTDEEVIKALDVLNKLDFFGGQRAGRELWSEKPVDVQNEDIENFSRDIAFLKDFITRQKAEIESLKGLIIRNDEKYLSYAATMIKEERELRQIERTRRLEAEIERLQSMNQAKLDTIHDIREELENAKFEAIKEFSEEF